MADTELETRLLEILAGCEGVTPGPWEARADPSHYDSATDIYAQGFIIAQACGKSFDGMEARAAHIARLDPDTVASMARLALEALASRRSGEAVGVAVKPLVWEDGEARSPLGDLYSVHRLSENVFSTRLNGTAFTGWEQTEVKAKAVAQEHFSTRILSALTRPVPVGETTTTSREDGIREAAEAVLGLRDASRSEPMTFIEISNRILALLPADNRNKS